MITEQLVDLSRLQFAITAMYHFLFVPLTLGLSFILVIMELAYVGSGHTVYQDMVKFWGKLFSINFALGVTTGITLEFQFGTNWAYYSHYVGDIFGAPLAIEGLMAFFLESTFIGLFFFGWERLGKKQHLMVTVLMALGSNLSALWILIANGWMQNPVGAEFSYTTMRMEMIDFWAVVFNPVAQAKFVHTVAAGYVTAALFVLGISSYYLLKGQDTGFARRSFRIAAAFGFAAALSVIVLGDESGYSVGAAQQTKLAALEAMWQTEPAPAPLVVVAWPDAQKQRNDYEIKLPYVLGLLGTRSFSKTLPGIAELKERNRARIERGILAVTALERLRRNRNDVEAIAEFDQYRDDLGFGLLLKKYRSDVENATPEQIQAALDDTIPSVLPMFWSFRIMVALSLTFLLLFGFALWSALRNDFSKKKWLLRWALWSIPLPWLAAELGWVVAEYGRQPWSIYGILPTHIAVSSHSSASLYASLTGFILFYTLLLLAELYLMFKYARLGPARTAAA